MIELLITECGCHTEESLGVVEQVMNYGLVEAAFYLMT